MKQIPFLSTSWAWAGLALCLAGPACTEKKTKSLPAPVTPPTVPVTNEARREYAEYTELVWSDEFDGTALDQSKWSYELGAGGWGNNELETYTNSTDNTRVGGGELTIEAKPSGAGYTSARLITAGKKDFVFGRFDVRAKLPKGKGIWPAIWMLGSNIGQINWPACGEIDIMELKGSQPNQSLSTMHFGTANDHQYRSGQWQTLAGGATFADDYHIFSLVRSRDLIRSYIDGREVFSFTPVSGYSYPFNDPFFAILNVAVGGNFDGNPDATTVFPQQMKVDYVRFYQYK